MRFRMLHVVNLALITLIQVILAGSAIAQLQSAKLEPPLPFDEVVRILRPREVDVEIQELFAPANLNDIVARFREAASKNQEWFLETVKRSHGPIPYDARMGISESEYERFKNANNEIRLRPAGAGRLRFEVSSDAGKVTIFNVKNLPQLDGIRIDLTKRQVQTKWGELVEKEHVRNDDSESPTGRWHAYGWTLIEGTVDKGNFKSVQMSVGHHFRSKRPLIYLKARVLRPNGIHERADAFVLLAD